MSEIRFESTAREIAASIIARSGRRLPAEILLDVEEMLVDAAHDGAEFAESYVVVNDHTPTGLEHYTLGYMHGLRDYERGNLHEEGEE